MLYMPSELDLNNPWNLGFNDYSREGLEPEQKGGNETHTQSKGLDHQEY